jgi:TPR repeat protein
MMMIYIESKYLFFFQNNKHQTISYVQRQLDDCCSTSCHTTSDNCSTTETLPSVAPRTSTQLANEYARNNTSRYAKVSYHLTNDPTAIKLYREMAEKGNDTTTQLIFAKYLLETANAFYPPNAINPPPKIVGSLWGVGTTTKKSQLPEPYMVVPSPDDGASSIIEPSTASNHSVTVAPSLHSSTTPSALAAIAVKQQQASVTGVPESSVVNEPRRQKIKALEDEAVKWIRKLAKQNVGEACYMLANWMDKELYGFKINKVKSIHLHSIASKSNIPESVFIVAQHYEEEGKVPSARIIKLYRSAVENDYVNAVYVS